MSAIASFEMQIFQFSSVLATLFLFSCTIRQSALEGLYFQPQTQKVLEAQLASCELDNLNNFPRTHSVCGSKGPH